MKFVFLTFTPRRISLYCPSFLSSFFNENTFKIMEGSESKSFSPERGQSFNR